MRLGILSDTHGNLTSTQAAVRMFESLEVERLLHCGDICSNEIPPLLARWPTDFVTGNCDYDFAGLRAACVGPGHVLHGRFAELEIAERRIALLHSDDAIKFREVTSSGAYDLVCYGHTHVRKIERNGRTLIVNPGALYRAVPYSIAVLDLATLEATLVEL